MALQDSLNSKNKAVGLPFSEECVGEVQTSRSLFVPLLWSNEHFDVEQRAYALVDKRTRLQVGVISDCGVGGELEYDTVYEIHPFV